VALALEECSETQVSALRGEENSSLGECFGNLCQAGAAAPARVGAARPLREASRGREALSGTLQTGPALQERKQGGEAWPGQAWVWETGEPSSEMLLQPECQRATGLDGGKALAYPVVEII
jgi:hypothetical protein